MHDKSPEFLKLQKLYEVQMRTLRRYLTGLEYMRQVSFLRGMKRNVIERAISLGLQDNETAFLAILQCSFRNEGKNIPLYRRSREKKHIPLDRQITFVRYFEGECERIGTFCANLSAIENTDEKIPWHYPYYLLGVNINIENIGLSAEKSTEDIKKRNQKPLNLAETISLAIHRPDLLKNYILLACGSQYGEKQDGKIKRVPCVQLSEGRPTIMWKHIDREFPQYISPFCKERLAVTILSGARTIIQGRPWREIRPV